MNTIAILGTGNVGSVLGKRLADAGYALFFGSRQEPSEAALKLSHAFPERVRFGNAAAAAVAADVILLATPWPAARGVLESVSQWTGKIIIDCTNPINDRFDGLTLGFTISAAEQIAEWAPGSHVVKAFNTVSVATMENPMYDGQPATVFYCGDHADAKQRVRTLITAVGLEPIDAGPLRHARYLEPLAMLYIHLAVHQRMGGNCAFKIMRR